MRRRLLHVWQDRGPYGFLQALYGYVVKQLRRRNAYQTWIARHQWTAADIERAQQQMAAWQQCPTFSLVLSIASAEVGWLEGCLRSLQKQIYPHWELWIIDDRATHDRVKTLVEPYLSDCRIKLIASCDTSIPAANTGLEFATGEYSAWLNPEDELAIHALYAIAQFINQHPDADFVYSDEDTIDAQGGRSTPFFKPDWSPEYFQAWMYTGQLSVYRTRLIREVGGLRVGYEGAQDYDLALRLVEKTSCIYHVPDVLYHRRRLNSTNEETARRQQASLKALESWLSRSLYPGRVEPADPSFFRVHREIVGSPLISIVIPSAGKTIRTANGTVCLLENCIHSIQAQSTYRRVEFVIVDGYDIPDSSLQRLTQPENELPIQLVHCAEPFNFSQRINQGAARSAGDVLLLLNDDVEVITPDWLESMLELAQQPEIGTVGAKLLYPDRRLQHAGVVFLSGNPGHVFHQAAPDHPGYFGSNIVNRNYLAVTAACLMMRRAVFEQIGGMNEALPLNYNDADLCLKVHQAGYRTVMTPFAQLLHYESATRRKGAKPEELATLMTTWKDYIDWLQHDPYYNPNFSQTSFKFELL